jgi:hypothetical protein
LKAEIILKKTMKLTCIVTLGLLMISFSTYSQDKNSDLKDFNNFLGQKKAIALNTAVESFDQFLKANFSTFENQSERTKAFLEYLQENFELNPTWKLSTHRNKKIISNFEASGLRKEIWLYGYEEFEPKYDIYEILPPRQHRNSKTLNLGEIDYDDLFKDELVPISNIDTAEIARRGKGRKYSKLTTLQYLWSIFLWPNQIHIKRYHNTGICGREDPSG